MGKGTCRGTPAMSFNRYDRHMFRAGVTFQARKFEIRGCVVQLSELCCVVYSFQTNQVSKLNAFRRSPRRRAVYVTHSSQHALFRCVEYAGGAMQVKTG